MGITLTKGDFAEIVVMKDLMERGYKICLPYGTDWRFDLVIFNGSKFFKIQVKTCFFHKKRRGVYIKASSLIFVKANSESIRHGYKAKYDKKQIDLIAAYNSRDKEIYYIPIEDFNGNGQMTLRLDDSRPIFKYSNRNVHMAKDYRDIKI